MKLPRDLSGRKFADGLCRKWEYQEVHQSGSHIILQTKTPSSQRISIPGHARLKIGTLNTLLRLVALHKRVSKEEVLRSIL